MIFYFSAFLTGIFFVLWKVTSSILLFLLLWLEFLALVFVEFVGILPLLGTFVIFLLLCERDFDLDLEFDFDRSWELVLDFYYSFEIYRGEFRS